MDLIQKTDLVLVRRKDAPSFATKFILGADYIVGPYTVPTGFQTDLASVPVGFRNIASKIDGIEASVLHDWLYATGSEPRDVADKIFLDLLKGAVPGWKRWIMYAAVRVGGGFSYKGN